MSGRDVFMALSTVLGGLALFLLGMSIMTDGLQQAAGKRLRQVLSSVARSRSTGVGLGTLLGFLVHSSAATVMLVAFVNAGLLSMVESIPAIMGANVGTTFSMQLLSLDVGAYCYFVIAFGFALSMAAPGDRAKQVGRSLIGFGMIFLGMNIMGDAIRPYRAELQPFLAGSDARTLRGMAFGIGVATLVTAIIQSSGATIGMCFALSSAGVFAGIENVFPIVLGAHMGTCATGLLGSIGTHIDARRTGLCHLMFNVVGVVLAVALARPLLWLVMQSSDDLIRQTANLHTLIMVMTTVVILPMTVLFARLVRLVSPSKQTPPEPSYLDVALISKPESAIYAAIRELQRMAGLSMESFRAVANFMLFRGDRKLARRVAMNERVINEIKLSMSDYLSELTHHYLSRRQSILIQHVDRCMIEIERIGDHIASLAEMSESRKGKEEALFTESSFEELYRLYEQACTVLEGVIQSLDPESKDFQATAREILSERDRYADLSYQIKDHFMARLEAKTETPIAGMYYHRYVSSLDRIVRHAKVVAMAEQQPEFWIKRKKLLREAGEPLPHEVPELVDPDDFLHKLKREDEL